MCVEKSVIWFIVLLPFDNTMIKQLAQLLNPNSVNGRKNGLNGIKPITQLWGTFSRRSKKFALQANDYHLDSLTGKILLLDQPVRGRIGTNLTFFS